MYASSYGRFGTTDRTWKSVVAQDSQSWNRYGYAGGDPVNKNDPSGLCSVMISGITMSPTAGSAWANEAAQLGSDTAYPYQGQGALGSVLSVIQQSSSPNAGTYAAYEAVSNAIASTAGLVDVVAYSGGAAAFTAAYNLLTDWQKSRIGLLLYISPGAATQLANVQGSTSVLLGGGVADNAATFGTQIPQGVPIADSNCDHTDLSCLFNAAKSTLSTIQSNGACSYPEVFTRSAPYGVAGAGIPSQGKMSTVGGSYWSGWGPVTIWIADPEPVVTIVTTTITFDPVQ